MTPSTTKFRDGLPKRGCRDENVVAACNAIKEWLSSSPKIKSPRVSSEKPSPEMSCKAETPSPKICCKSPEKESEKPSNLTPQVLNPSLASFSIDDQSGPSTCDPSPEQAEEADIAPEANSEAEQDSASTSPCTENEKVQLDINAHSAGNGSATNENGHVENGGTPGPFNLKNCPVGRWLEDIAEPSNMCTVDDAVNNFTRDIDVDNGSLLPELQHPMTMQTRCRGHCRDYKDMAWRQANMTAELQIRREMGSRHRLAAALERHQQASKASEAAIVSAEEEEVPWPKADCTVRPVKPRDFQQIADIMNLEREAKDCPQIIQPKVIQASDIKMIYEACQRAMQPFIVATACENELLDRSKWPKNADKAYQEYLRYVKMSRAKFVRQEPVYGFAFLKDARLGFVQDSSSASSFSCQLKMAVHPRHRKRSYGSALLDKILLTIGPYYKSHLDYHWTCPIRDDVYEEFAGHNRRQYNKMYLETFCIGKDDTEYDWRRAFLDKFGFREVAFFSDAAKTDHGHQSKWLALSLWAFDIQPSSKLKDRPLEN